MQIVKLVLGKGQVSKFECSFTLKDLLNRYPNSVYTALRTCGRVNGRWSILQLTSHYQRLLHSPVNIESLPTYQIPQLSDLKIVLDSLLQGVDTTSKLSDYRLTVIHSYDNNEQSCSLWGIVNEIPSQPPHISIKMALHQRRDPNIKSTSWIMERESLESLKGSTFNEVVLTDKNGYIYEGLSSNFAVISHSNQGDPPILVTAPDELILKGTVMQIVLKAAELLGWNIEKRLISINELRENDNISAFITSTSRLVIPVENISLIDDSTIKLNTQFPHLKKLMEKSSEILPSYCEQI